MDCVKTTGRSGKQTADESHVSCPQLAPGWRVFISRLRPPLSWAGLALHPWRRWRRGRGGGGLVLTLDSCLQTAELCSAGGRHPGLLITVRAAQEVKMTSLKGRVAITGRVSGDRSLFISVFSRTHKHRHAHAPAHYRRQVSGEHMTFSTPHFEEQLRLKGGSPSRGDFL